MAACIVNSMDDGRYLQVVYPIRSSSDEERGVPYRALFVRELEDVQRLGPKYVFTSWTRTFEKDENMMQTKNLAKYVCIEVDVEMHATHGRPILRTKKWTNGLCFFSGEAKFESRRSK